MATVRQPGSIIERVLPGDEGKPCEEQTILCLRVLNLDQWKRAIGILDSLSMHSPIRVVLERGKQILGIGLEDVRNLKILQADGTLRDFELKKTGNEITEESASVLYPYLREIIDCIKEAHTFKTDDAKN